MSNVIFEEDDAEFCKIRVDEFVSSSNSPSDIFIKIGDRKFIKIAREESAIDLNRIRHYKEKAVEHFLVRRTDFHKYSGLNLKLVKAVTGNSRIPKEKKLMLLKHSNEVLL